MRTVTIVGASVARLSAARAPRAQGHDGQIVLWGAEPHRPYDRPPLSKDFLLGRVCEEDLALHTAEDDEMDLEWRLGTSAVRLDCTNRAVILASSEEIRADGVVIATGARQGAAGDRRVDGVHTLRTLDDAMALRETLRRGGRLVVVGSGSSGPRSPRPRGPWVPR